MGLVPGLGQRTSRQTAVVTMTVPAAMLSQLDPARLEWLVPGLLRDKCIALLKSLPKSIRRQVVPIPDWACSCQSLNSAAERLLFRRGVAAQPLSNRIKKNPLTRFTGYND